LGYEKNLAKIQLILAYEGEFAGLIKSHGSRQRLSNDLIGQKKSATPFQQSDWQPWISTEHKG